MILPSYLASFLAVVSPLILLAVIFASTGYKDGRAVGLGRYASLHWSTASPLAQEIVRRICDGTMSCHLDKYETYSYATGKKLVAEQRVGYWIITDSGLSIKIRSSSDCAILDDAMERALMRRGKKVEDMIHHRLLRGDA